MKESLVSVIESQPEAVESWLVYCDWLEETGSDRVVEIRSQLRHRLPMAAEEFAKFGAWTIAANRLPSDDDFAIEEIAHEFRADLEKISKTKIFRNFERDLEGRLPLKKRVILASYGNDPLSRSRQDCLVVDSPTRRRGPQCLTISIKPFILRNQANNWSGAPWLWQDACDSPDLIQPKDVLFKNAASMVSSLHSKSNLNGKELQQLSTHLMDLGRYKEAFELFGVQWDESLDGVQYRVPFVWENPRAEKRYTMKLAEGEPERSSKLYLRWISAVGEHGIAINHARGLREQIWFVAPWKLKSIIERGFDHLGSKSKPAQECKLPLFEFPKNTQGPKRTVFIGCDKNGESHRIFIDDDVTSNDNLPLVEWQRGFLFDMERLGVAKVPRE